MKTIPLTRPGVFVPILMSMIAIAMVAGHALIYGTTSEAEEGTAAHIFQLLIILQIPIIVLFAVKWLPKEPRAAAWSLPVSYTHLRAHETVLDLVCRLLLEKKKQTIAH